MQRILTELSTTITDFKINPNREVKRAGNKPFAVLTNNKPSFYVMSAEAYDELLETLWELKIAPVILERMGSHEKSVSVDLKDL